MTKNFYISLFIVFFMFSCKNITEKKNDIAISETDLKEKINSLNNLLTESAKAKDFDKVNYLYLENAIVLAEYNPLIDGKKNIEKFYKEIFSRQELNDYEKETSELFDFGETILEIGNFKKTLIGEKNQEGKYFNVWKKFKNGNLRLKSESFGFYHPIENPSKLRVLSIKDTVSGLSARAEAKIPIELDAYDSRNENIVRDRDTKKIIQSYTDDGIYYPFANSKKSGIESLTNHYKDYHKTPVKIDSIEVWTFDYEPVTDGIIKYSKFYVEWATSEFSGSTNGTGLIYYRRQKDNSLKIHRQIGLHIHEE